MLDAQWPYIIPYCAAVMGNLSQPVWCWTSTSSQQQYTYEVWYVCFDTCYCLTLTQYNQHVGWTKCSPDSTRACTVRLGNTDVCNSSALDYCSSLWSPSCIVDVSGWHVNLQLLTCIWYSSLPVCSAIPGENIWVCYWEHHVSPNEVFTWYLWIAAQVY